MIRPISGNVKMTRWSDNALFRASLAGIVTMMLGSCIGSPLVLFLADGDIPLRSFVSGIWLLAMLVGIITFFYSRRVDRPLQWAKAGRCRMCGYDLTGNVTGRCPECGTVCESSELDV